MKTIIQDVCDVLLKRISDGKIIFTAEAQLSSVSQKVNTQDIRGGFGSKLIAVLKSEKSIELTVRDAVWNGDYLEMISGTSFSSATNTIFTKEEDLLSTNGTTVAITGTPKTGGTIKVIAADGTQYAGTFATGTVTFTGGVSGDYYTCLYQIEVTGNTLSIQSDKFSEKYYIEYHTIEYDIETNAIKNDMYWIFNSVLPDDNFDLSFESGKAISPEVKLRALTASNTSVIGKVIEIPRV